MEGNDADRRIYDERQVLQCTYQAKALAADDFAFQVILLDPWSGSSEGEDRCDCHCIVISLYLGIVFVVVEADHRSSGFSFLGVRFLADANLYR